MSVRDWNGTTFGTRELNVQYTGDEAHQLMMALNKANLTQQSLTQRIYTKILNDGRIPGGTQSGNPD